MLSVLNQFIFSGGGAYCTYVQVKLQKLKVVVKSCTSEIDITVYFEYKKFNKLHRNNRMLFVKTFSSLDKYFYPKN